MMAEIISSKNVKTRKDHHCVGCNRLYYVGSKMERITSADEGKIRSDYWCDVCTAYWSEHMENGDEIGPGELKSEDPGGWEKMRQSVERRG